MPAPIDKLRTSLPLAALLVVPGLANAQNLIPNPSFEDYTINCQPFGADYDWIEDWTSPGCSNNPWVLHSCNQTIGPWASVPSNQHGYQAAQDGDAYMAIVPFITNSQGGWDGNPSTYASVEFASPLVGGVEYCVQIWASLADSSSYSTSLLSAFIWYGIPSTCGGQDSAWDTYSQVSFDITPVDTLNWHLLEGSFVAAGGETSLTLGSFQSEAEVDTVFLFDHIVSDAAIYFVDNVYLGPCDVAVQEPPTSPDLLLTTLPGAVQVTWPSTLAYHTLRLYDTQGRLIESHPVQSSTVTIPVRTAGIFLVEAVGTGMRTVRRVAIQ